MKKSVAGKSLSPAGWELSHQILTAGDNVSSMLMDDDKQPNKKDFMGGKHA
jgi:hypothetical protein